MDNILKFPVYVLTQTGKSKLHKNLLSTIREASCGDGGSVERSEGRRFNPRLRSPMSMYPRALESEQLKQEVTHIEEERIQVVNNIEELEQKIKDLDNQTEESVREMEVECALLEGEQESEMTLMEREQELLDQLKKKIHRVEKPRNSEKPQDSGEQTQSMEHLEFQKLEREINQGEEKDDQSREILREIAECQRVAVTRKKVKRKTLFDI
ncbi:Pleckstrin y-like domain family B member 2 [Liparis tanakae]|uniref:Pleckstrin y-like domain family B member 2 n=1 Tax=Liparis tanakae TaxID=230148 RepID=A0A4Z2GCJ5_9TELE|nr:Pleckstrin y-like domain family B member 2 [Liparis tanakae]